METIKGRMLAKLTDAVAFATVNGIIYVPNGNIKNIKKLMVDRVYDLTCVSMSCYKL